MFTEFFYRYKKLLMVIAFVLFTLLFAFLLYLMFLKPFIGPGEDPTATTTPGGFPAAEPGDPTLLDPTDPIPLPPGLQYPAVGDDIPSPIAAGGLTQTTELVKKPTLGATLAGDGLGAQFYDQESGHFYRLDDQGNLSLLSDRVFHQVQNIIWSPTKNKAILEYPDDSKIIYDFDNKKQITLPKHWEDFEFSPDGKEIVLKSLGLDPENRFLVVIDDTATAVKVIDSIGTNDEFVYPTWSPNKQVVALHTEGIDFDRQEVFFVGQHNENFKSTVIHGRGFQPQWSPKGDKLVYSVYSSTNDMKPTLWMVNASGEAIGSGRTNLGVETWADKCTFSGTSDFYCAVPEYMPENAGWFPELGKTTKDHLYQIDIHTGAKKRIAVPDGAYNINNVIVTENEQYLYFTDSTSGHIHKINLKP